MAYEVVMPYHLHMPSYFLETFTEYPYLGNRSRDWATGSRTPEKRYGIPVSRCKALF